MHRASVLKISHNRDMNPVNMTALFLYGLKVKKRLCSVLSRTVPRINKRHGTHRSAECCASFLRVTHADNIRVLADDPDCIFDRFAFVERTELHTLGTDDPPSQPVHRGGKT